MGSRTVCNGFYYKYTQLALCTHVSSFVNPWDDDLGHCVNVYVVCQTQQASSL